MSRPFLNRASTKTSSFNSIDKYSYVNYKHPIKEGKYFFTYAYYNNLGVPALFCRNNLNSNPRILIDPNYITKKDKIELKTFALSKDSKYLAYQFDRNGSDWAEIKIVNIEDGIHKKDHLKGIKFSGIEWKDNGFYYSTIEQTSNLGKILGEKVFYHKLGNLQAEDKLVFYRKNNPQAQFYYMTTSNERFFILEEENEKTGHSGANSLHATIKEDADVYGFILNELNI